MKSVRSQIKDLSNKTKRRPTGLRKSVSQKPDFSEDNAARERSRVKSLRAAFADLQRALPCVPPDTKLSKLDVLVLGMWKKFNDDSFFVLNPKLKS